LNCEGMLQIWLNTQQYHHGRREEHQQMEEMFAGLPRDFGKAIFISQIVDKVYAIYNLTCIVAFIIGRTTKLQLSVLEPVVGAGNFGPERQSRKRDESTCFEGE